MAFKPRIKEDLRKPKPVTRNGEENRKPNLWLWIKKNQETEPVEPETVVAVYLHRFISLVLLFVSL